MVKAVFFDIDGTLVSFTTHTIPDSTRRALQALRQNGVKVFIATGRPPAQTAFLDTLADFRFDGIVPMNGHYSTDETRPFYEKSIPAASLQFI